MINPEYTDPESFTDIFSTQSLASARVILNQLEAINTNVYGKYNPATLNASSRNQRNPRSWLPNCAGLSPLLHTMLWLPRVSTSLPAINGQGAQTGGGTGSST